MCVDVGRKNINRKKKGSSGDRWQMGMRGRCTGRVRVSESRACIYTDCRILKGTVRFYWIILGRQGEEGIKILDGNEPPEVISFRLLFCYPSHEKQLFLLCYVNFFFGPPPSRGQMRARVFFIYYYTKCEMVTKRKERKKKKEAL